MNGVELAAQVHNVAFGRAPRGLRGYSEEDVDKFLDQLEQALASGADPGSVTALIKQAQFGKPPIGKRGYSPEEVDVFLDYIDSAYGPTAADSSASSPAEPGVVPGHDTGAPRRQDPPRPSSGIVEHKSFLQRLLGR